MSTNSKRDFQYMRRVNEIATCIHVWTYWTHAGNDLDVDLTKFYLIEALSKKNR